MTPVPFSVALAWCLLAINTKACTFNDAKTGIELDVTALAYTSLSYREPDSNWTYYFTPCRNGEQCTMGSRTDTGMFIRNEEPENNCQVLANWENLQPTFNQVDETWTFKYQNGNLCKNKSTPIFYAYFACDMDAGDYRIVSAGMMNECEFEMYIETQWGCPGQHYEEADEDQMSFGTYFLVVLFAMFVIYCGCGWIFATIKNGKHGDCVGNIPHVTFWSKLPLLVFAGCVFTKDFLYYLCVPKTSHAPAGDYGNLDRT